MIRKAFIPSLFAALLLLGACISCRRAEQPLLGSGVVTMVFNTGEPATRASVGDGDIDDGGGIAYGAGETEGTLRPDLIILIVNEDGQVIHRKVRPELNPADITSAGGGLGATRVSVSFTWSELIGGAGTYSVYALANTAPDGGNLTINSAPDWSTFTDAAEMDNLKFTALTLTNAPAVGDRMPLSAIGSITVYKDSNDEFHGQADLELLRCLAKVQLGFKNLTGSELNLYNVWMKVYDMNTATGWLFPPVGSDFVTLGDGNSDGKDDNYRDIQSDPKNLTGIPTENSELAVLDEMLVFPSIARMQTLPSKGKRYLCDIHFRIQKNTEVPYDSGNSSTYLEKDFNNLPIHDSVSKDILSLSRNQFLLIEATVSKKVSYDVSFNFIVKEWEEPDHHISGIFH